MQVYSDNVIFFVLLFLNPYVRASNNVRPGALAKRKQAGVFRIERFIAELANPEYRQVCAIWTPGWHVGSDYLGQYHKTPQVRVSELC